MVDECAPKALKQSVAAHGQDCITVQEAGWSGKRNGELLALAETEFDVLVKLDTNLRYQQNLTGRPIAIVVLRAPSNRLVTSVRSFLLACRRWKRSSPGKSSK